VPRLVPLAAVAALVVCVPTTARAFERQWHLGGGLGVARPGSGGDFGIAAGFHVAYGLSDYFDLRLEGVAAQHSFADGEKTLVHSIGFGVAYKLDVLEWVPYAGIELVGYGFDGDPGPDRRAGSYGGASLDAGLDYALSRSFALGTLARMHVIGGRPSHAPPAMTWYTVLFRAEYRWGW
jgi:hypothetical protein